MNKISRFILQISNWLSLILLAILFLIFNLYFFPKSMDASLGNNNLVRLPILDLQFGYNPENVKKIAAMYKGIARTESIKMTTTIDTVYPVIYSLMLSVAISMLFLKGKKSSSYFWLNLLPFVILLFDYAENFCIIQLLTAAPFWDIDYLAKACSIFTLSKWLMTIVCFILSVFGVVKILLKKNLIR